MNIRKMKKVWSTGEDFSEITQTKNQSHSVTITSQHEIEQFFPIYFPENEEIWVQFQQICITVIKRIIFKKTFGIRTSGEDTIR